MSRFAGLLVVAVSLGACAKTIYRSGEGQYCSITSEDPGYECSPSVDLVCITTSSVESPTDGGSKAPGFRPLYLCRLACTPGDPCTQAGDVCCPGVIYGQNYGKTHGCVPVSECDTEMTTIVIRDAGVDRGFLDAAPATRADAAVDTALDAPVSPGDATDSAAVDAAASDTALDAATDAAGDTK